MAKKRDESLELQYSSNDSSYPCIKCIKNEEVGGKSLNEIQIFHLTIGLLNIQVLTLKRDICVAIPESGGRFLKESLVKKKMVFV